MVKLYLCLNCKQLVIPTANGKCPKCGKEELTDKWEGLIILIDPENSKIAKIKDLKEKGIYPIFYKEV